MTCPADSKCGIGAIAPSKENSTSQLVDYILRQPKQFVGRPELALPTLYFALLSSASFAIILITISLILGAIFLPVYDFYSRFEYESFYSSHIINSCMYSTKHNHRFGYMYKMRTPFGGIFSLIAIAFALGGIVSILVPSIADNERKCTQYSFF